MSKAPNIGLKESIALGTMVLLAKVLLPYFAFLTHKGLSGTWVVILMHLPIAVVGVLVLAWLLKAHPGKSVVEIGDELVGPVVSLIFSFAIVIFFVMLVGFELRQFSGFLLTVFLINTPLSVVAMAFLLAMVVVAYKGIDITARVAWLFFFPFLFSVALLLALTGNLWETHGLYPVLGPGVGGLARAVATSLGVGSEIILLTIIAPFMAPKIIRPAGLAAVLVSGGTAFFIMIVAFLTFPFPVTEELTLATFEISRAINIGRFLVRLETLFMPIWMLVGLISMTAGLYAAAAVTARALKMPYYRPFVFPMAVLVTAVCFSFPNLPTAAEISFSLVFTWSPVLIGLVLGTLVSITALRTWKEARRKGRS